MKQTMLKSFVLGLALVIATSAFAGSTSGSLSLSKPAQLNGTQIPAGDYKVKWDGSGSNVQVTIWKGKEKVAEAPAQLQELPNKSEQDAAVLRKNDDGSMALSGIRLSGKKTAIRFGEAGDMGGTK